jgi:putative spermidine/putrescine transport system substrate-binding protein
MRLPLAVAASFGERGVESMSQAGRIRSFLLVLTLAYAGSIGGAVAQEQTKKVYYLNDGGTTVTMMEKNGWAAEFQKDTGYELVMVQTGNSEESIATAVAQKKHPQVDVVESDYASWLRGYNQGIFAEIDPKAIPNLSELYDRGRIEKDGKLFAVSPFIYVCGIIYNREVFEKNNWPPPKSWTDLFDPKFRGKLIVPAPSSTYGMFTLIELARANGGSERDIDPGFAALARLAPNVVDYTMTGAKIAQLMRNGTAHIAVYSISQSRSFRTAGVPAAYVIPSPAYANPSILSVTAGGPNPRGAEAFLNWAISKKVLTFRAKEFGQTPLNRNVSLGSADDGGALFDANAISHLVSIDYEYASKHRGEWIRRFESEIAPIKRAD